ncbi:hypothetical protein ElyMa_000360700 [Elysia marginata]|uniref:Uncharacterized protein n=1 Tax=Elysia marginata TaxID=1093978 RepID=A0AAV4FHA8_9GAST|nr:hypothetical protein ElyMa_000360700 [Elysia marginata]
MENQPKDESNLSGFEGRCLRRILAIWWEHRVSNKEISERTGIRPSVEKQKKIEMAWTCHKRKQISTSTDCSHVESTRSKKERKTTGYLEEIIGK